MTTPQPSLPGFRTAIEIDLMSLPLVRPWMNRYRSQILANNAARRGSQNVEDWVRVPVVFRIES